MWYLILPPIIVVLSLSFVLWYLSRKGDDPVIASKIAALDEAAQQRIPFLRTKNFIFGMLEKTTYRFKVHSLRLHNALHVWTQAIKLRRRNFQEKVAIEDRGMPERRKEQSTSFWGVLKRKNLRTALTTGLDGKRPLSHTEVQVSRESVGPELGSVRSMVSETVVHPDTLPRTTERPNAREEDLIARIAVNPKDFSAYEALGDFYLEQANLKDAKECYRQVLKLSPLRRTVKIKIRRLERLLEKKDTNGQ